MAGIGRGFLLKVIGLIDPRCWNEGVNLNSKIFARWICDIVHIGWNVDGKRLLANKKYENSVSLFPLKAI